MFFTGYAVVNDLVDLSFLCEAYGGFRGRSAERFEAQIVPFNEEHVSDVCRMLDSFISHEVDIHIDSNDILTIMSADGSKSVRLKMDCSAAELCF